MIRKDSIISYNSQTNYSNYTVALYTVMADKVILTVKPGYLGGDSVISKLSFTNNNMVSRVDSHFVVNSIPPLWDIVVNTWVYDNKPNPIAATQLPFPVYAAFHYSYNQSDFRAVNNIVNGSRTYYDNSTPGGSTSNVSAQYTYKANGYPLSGIFSGTVKRMFYYTAF